MSCLGVVVTQRENQVLASLVSEYIATGEPAGSRTLARKYTLGVSAATVRNTMSDLEEMGLVFQPHTSAGRLPTDCGIRRFVDTLMEVQDLTEERREAIRRRFGNIAPSPYQWQQTGRLLSELTQQATVVLSPRLDSMVLREVRFLHLRANKGDKNGKIVAVLVGSSGIVQNRILEVNIDLPRSKLDRIHNYLNELIPGRTLAEARQAIEREMEESRKTVDLIRTRALELGRDALAGAEKKCSVVVHGQSRLIRGHGFSDIDRLRQLMELLDDQDKLAALLDATMLVNAPNIVIGAEHPVTGLAHCSVIVAAYGRQDEAQGTLGVIGPRNMDYSRVLPVVEFAAHIVSDPSGNGE